MEDLTGKQLGQYQIVTRHGKGGMATVYKAYQPKMDRYVALKILPRHFASDPEFVGRFEQEAKVIAQLQHPHILPVHDYGEHDGYTYIVMPFVETGTLADLLQGQPIPLERIKKIISQVGDALDYAHSRGVIHRDVKPSNILIDERGNCLLTDFGIAKMVEATIEFTQSGGILGTPAYMSPEQGLGEQVDERSDIYSLGVVLYEMTTGKPPYQAETPMAVLIKHIHDPLPPPSSINPSIPDYVEKVILKSLAKNREDRYSSASEMIVALQIKTAVDDSTLQAFPPQPPGDATEPEPVAREWWSRRPVPFAGLVFIAVVAFAVYMLTRGNEKTEVVETQIASGQIQELSETLITPFTSTPTLKEVTPTKAVVIQSVTPTPLTSVAVNPKDGADFVLIPGGEFLMGLTTEQADSLISDSNCSNCADEVYASVPSHLVSLDAYWIYRTEVTNEMYGLCVDAGECIPPSSDKSEARSAYFRNPAYANFPVIYVSWFAARGYCEWAGGRLPTEAEWEKAARGTDGVLFPWGNKYPNEQLANINSYVGDTADVEAYKNGASPYGMLNMVGNVYEWVADWYSQDYYRESDYANPKGPATGTTRSIRGGSWYYGLPFSSAAVRDWWEPDESGSGVGFRCVLDRKP